MATKRALIVDDSKTAQFRLKKLLREYDLTIVAVDSAEAALSYLSSNVPDVVFLDHMMPGLDGFRALQIIKSHPVTARIPVIMYTSKTGDVYASEARSLGALDILNKDSINADELRAVLASIQIFPDERPERELAPAPVPEQAPPTAATLSSGDDLLSVELRLRELERAIEDNRRMVTSRLVREIQAVRHGLRKVLGEVAELKHQRVAAPPAAPNPQPRAKKRAGRYWSAMATVLLLSAVGASLYWAPEIYQKVDRVAAMVQEEIRQYTDSRDSARNEHALSSEAGFSARPSSQAFVQMPAMVEADRSMDLLPELSWAFNQSSIQDFHAEGLDPMLTKRLDELASRLAHRHFQGTIELQVSGGDFCVVTNLSGKPRLPHSGAQMRDCMLMSELYGAKATQSKAQRLRSALSELTAVDERRITVTILPVSETFEAYPVMDARTPARDWNEAARQNNRVLVHLKPDTTTQTALRQ
ncbi:response regulator [Marinimicrobium sp. ABcell2]|uniref:response regulator n=1 Tax=Marinimicrobium sp. ABcell2 TaxID=3069751 RepID=UPI0027B1BB07|nr:response regulator [Marinimicrobium sp. ABcell2]MDQ2077880.1 response regulator [Marinimicrobium sp. ABcell2]